MPQQVVRLGILFVLAVASLVGARSFLVPETFGELGHYRAAALTTIAAREPRFAGRQECLDCHDDVGAKAAPGFHRALSCEACHGPQGVHAADPDSTPKRVVNDRALCTLCHAYNASRPSGFPQVDEAAHNPLTACVKCHDPHTPATGRAPGECGACHGHIARQKVSSHHAYLPCTTCHAPVPDRHRVSPREALPTKPADRAFCGKCHAPAAARPAFVPATRDIPKVDIATHGGRYLCWQCHYPHYPEK